MHAVFLTVADPDVGLGHLYRCDALATALVERGFETSIAIDCRNGIDWLQSRASEAPWRALRWTDDAHAMMRTTADAERVVIDAYDIAPEVREAIEHQEAAPICFDDYGTNVPERGVVINGSPGAHLINYPERPGLVVLLGPHYQVLRKPFWQPTDRAVRERLSSVGVMLGGTDHRGLMDSVLSVVRQTVHAETTVYAIGVEPNSIRTTAIEATGYLSADELKNLFDRLDLLVSAAGQTVAEAVACRLPTVMIQTAENQRYNLEGWTTVGAAVSAGSYRDPRFSGNLTEVMRAEGAVEPRRAQTSAAASVEVSGGAQRLSRALAEVTET